MNWFRKIKDKNQPVPDFTTSILFNEDTFYNEFIKDLLEAKNEVIIESPFITNKRLRMLKPVFEKLMNKGIEVYIITKDPREHDGIMVEQSEAGIRYFEVLGVQVLLIKGGHHRKLAMIDRKILYEGSLNILSQSQSREIMRRTDNQIFALQMIDFLKLSKVI